LQHGRGKTAVGERLQRRRQVVIVARGHQHDRRCLLGVDVKSEQARPGADLLQQDINA
jgi:hypothetical protein